MTMESDSLKIKKDQVATTFSFFDGHREEVLVFLPEQQGYHLSLVRRLLGYFNDPSDNFLSVKHRNATQTIIIRKSRIRWVELPQSAELSEEDRVGVVRRIGIAFPRGDTIRGAIHNDLPSGKQRVRDFLNQKEPFFLLEGEKRLFLVNREATSRVYDPPMGEMRSVQPGKTNRD